MFAAKVFRGAAWYGFLVLVPQYFLEARTSLQSPPAITHPEYYYGFVGVALAWQAVFLIIARDPVRFRPLMLPAIFEKASFGLAVIPLYLLGRTPAPMMAAGLIDLVLGGLFLQAYRTTAEPS